jgi:AhpD family alkylhydroperoxidase
MTFINYVKSDEASGRLKTIYDKYTRPNSKLSNIISAHSLRPHMLEGHMAFYRAILYHSANKLPLWFLEAIGIYVSYLNGCSYCISHHTLFGRGTIDDKQRWEGIVASLTGGNPESAFRRQGTCLVSLCPRCNDGSQFDYRTKHL